MSPDEQILLLTKENLTLREALHDLLDSLERGDGFHQRERMARAGRLLGLQRHDGATDA